MRTQDSTASLFRSLACLTVLGALLLCTGCMYNGHRSYGATEKWVHSDINYVPKIIGTPVIAIVDGVIGPFTAACDEWSDRPLYNPNHKYLSYAGSRVIARSNISDGYKWLASVPSLILDTVWLLVTGPVDLFTVLFSDEDTDAKNEAQAIRLKEAEANAQYQTDN